VPVTALQLEYSLLERTSEGKLIPMAQAVGMGVMLSPAPRLSRSPGSGTARIMSTLIGARRIGRFEANLTALGLTLDPAQQERLTSVSAPHLNFPAENDATLARIARNGGTTVDGGPAPVPPRLVQGAQRGTRWPKPASGSRPPSRDEDR
jgi:aryl-alcohol dehydrogenase-like predicted oxidoreductase